MGQTARDTFAAQPQKPHPQDYSSDATPIGPQSKDDAAEELATLQAELAESQEMLFARGIEGDPRRVLLVLQGMDTSGKGGVTEAVVGAFNPSGVHFASFKKPTAEELAQHFLWRIRKRVPSAGQVGVFDRSHYEDVLVVKVRELIPAAEIDKRYDEINAFEAELAEGGVRVVKCFLHIDYDEQRKRLLARLDDPAKHWKFREGDIDDRALWPAFQDAYGVALTRCSTATAPWYVIPANRKWYRNWAIAKILAETFEDMNLSYPSVELDVPRLQKRLEPPN